MDIYNGWFKGYKGTYYGVNRQKSFADTWSDVSSFLEDYKTCGIPALIKDENASTLYYLLYASFGNSTIRNSDINQFKYMIFSRIFMYGPTWEKRLEVQSKIRSLSDKELLAGSKAIYNTALNPSTEPGTDTTEELDYINQQNVTKYQRNKMDAYALLMDLLQTDVTKTFVDGFKPFFKQVATKELPLVYETEVTE